MDYKKIIPKIIKEYENKEGDVEGLDSNGEEGVAEYIAYELSKIEKTTNDIWKIKKEIENMSRDFNKKLEEKNKAIRKIQTECRHWDKTYHGDPSGGSDSHHECEICGFQY